MKTKAFNDLKGKTIKELEKLALDKKLAAKKGKIEVAAGKEKNIKSAFLLRKEIARILTLIREKEILEKMEGKKEGGGAK